MRYRPLGPVVLLTLAGLLGPFGATADAYPVYSRHSARRSPVYRPSSARHYSNRPYYGSYSHYRYVRPYYGRSFWPRYYGSYWPRYHSWSYWPGYSWSYWPSYSWSYWPGYGGVDAAFFDQSGYSYWRAAVRTDVEPKETEVYADGDYAGIADDFDGMFQRLYLPPGQHEIELRLQGYRAYRQNILLSSGRTVKIHHQMQPMAPGEPAPPPPTPRERVQVEEPRKPGSQREIPEPAAPAERAEPEPTPPEERTEDEQPRSPAERQAPPEEPRRGVAEGRFGMLSVRVQPSDAEVLIDGELWGTLAGLEDVVIHVPVGQHRIEVRKEGFQSFVTDVDIRRGETTPLNVKLAARQL